MKKKVKRNRYLSLIILVSLIIILSLYLKNRLTLNHLVPKQGKDLYIKEPPVTYKNNLLKTTFKAQDALSITYGINGLKNSKIVLEIFKYSYDYDERLKNHLNSESIQINDEEIALPCTDITIFEVDIKQCTYSQETVNVQKLTFPLESDLIIRLLCTEGSLAQATKRCNEMAQEVIKRAK